MSDSATGQGYIFRGTEVDDFIRHVRGKAFSLGKQRDNDWMADYAATCLAGEPLEWYEALDEQTQTDWKLLRQGLLSKFGVASMGIHPQDSVAGSSKGGSLIGSLAGLCLQGTQRGRLRVKIEGSEKRLYLSRHWSASTGTTGEAHCLAATKNDFDFAEVKFTPSDALHNINIVNFSEPYNMLGITWYFSDPSTTLGSDHYSHLAAVNTLNTWEFDTCIIPKYNVGPTKTTIWKVDRDGSVVAIWPDAEGGTPQTLCWVTTDNGYYSLELVADCARFLQAQGGAWRRASVKFEPF